MERTTKQAKRLGTSVQMRRQWKKRTTEQVKQAMEQQTKIPKDRPVKRQKGIQKGERR